MKLIKMNFKERKPFFIQMGTIVAILVAFMAFNPVNAQEREKIAEEDTTIYTEVEIMPEYQGGTDSMRRFINENLQWNPNLGGIEGAVLVGVIVEKDGSLSNFEIIRSLVSIWDKEAIRVIKLMPKWIPGKKDGKVVRVKYTIPVYFVLN